MSYLIITDSGINQQYKDYISEFLLESAKDIEYKDIRDINTGSFKETSKIDLILLTGGADVNPQFYGENKGPFTFTDKTRDEEYKLFSSLISIKDNTPKLGICMGGQALHVMNGGKLIQHVEGHNEGAHSISTGSNPLVGTLCFNVPSDHHQMMYYTPNPFKGSELVAWSTKYRSNVYLDGDNNQIELDDKFLEPEIIYYKDNNTLCIQSHPEYMSVSKYDKMKFGKIIRKYLNL